MASTQNGSFPTISLSSEALTSHTILSIPDHHSPDSSPDSISAPDAIVESNESESTAKDSFHPNKSIAMSRDETLTGHEGALGDDTQNHPDPDTSEEVLMSMESIQRMFYQFFVLRTTKTAKLFNYISIAFIFASVIIVCLETLPAYLVGKDGTSSSLEDTFFPLETVIEIWWAVEYFGRLYASPNRLNFVIQIINVIDLMSLLPYFLLIVNNETAREVGKTLRVLRMLKIVKFANYSVGIQLAVRAIKRSTDAVWMLLLYLIIVLLFTSTMMYWAERGTYDPEKKLWIRVDGEISPFNSIPEGFYWSITTLSTVGYGDVTPITPWGKFVAALTMTLSVITIALPTSVIGSNFMAEWQIRQREQLQKKIRKNRERHAKLHKTYDLGTPVRIEKRVDQSKLLHEQNTLLLQTVAEIQEKLSDVNPPQYYSRFKEITSKYERAQEEIASLEKSVLKLRKALHNLQYGQFKMANLLSAASISDHSQPVLTSRKKSKDKSAVRRSASDEDLRNNALKKHLNIDILLNHCPTKSDMLGVNVGERKASTSKVEMSSSIAKKARHFVQKTIPLSIQKQSKRDDASHIVSHADPTKRNEDISDPESSRPKEGTPVNSAETVADQIKFTERARSQSLASFELRSNPLNGNTTNLD